VAAVTKIYGVVIMTLVGAFAGGALAMRFGVQVDAGRGAVRRQQPDVWCGLGSRDVNALIFVISADNLASGIASAASSPTCPA
jgi:PAT family beta-lactamase induction signal transducer AmpG